MIYYNDSTDFPGGQQQFVEDYEPSAGQMFKIGFGAGLDDTTLGLLTSISAMDAAENAPVLTKEDWEASKFYDPEIKWDDSFTTPKARLLKERRDRERELGFLLERAGIGSTAAFYGGAIAGTVPDIVNYIPFVGIASKAKSAAVLGKIAQSGRLGRGATTAADAVLGTALIQPLVAAERDTYQLKYDTRDALTELGLALGLGFGLGAALGRVHPKDRTVQEVADRQRGQRVTPDGETTPDNLPPEPTNTRAQQDWDSVAPTDKVEAVRRKIANDAVGTQDNVPVVRQQGAQQAIAQETARQQGAELISNPVLLAVEKFKAWFKTSKVVDSKGNPLIVYHGTSGLIKDFDLTQIGKSLRQDGLGFYFTTNVDDADMYAHFAAEAAEDLGKSYQANIMPVYLSLQNPLVVDVRGKSKQKLRQSAENYIDNNVPELRERIKEGGHDGLIVRGDNEDVYVALEPNQIRSVFEDWDNIPDEVWNTPRPAPEPLPAPDDTPISANEARLQQKEAALDERIRTAEANGTLSETDARELAYIDEEIVELDKYHKAVSETIECVIANG